ncbi:MAG: nucleoside monophosphate kinase [Phycisphaerales bacterium]|nr:nucleoside monophosphate kinase [Phycisphaerales bacterium]
MNTRHKSILLFGAPGVGKGTQGKFLGGIPGFHHLACGDVFRALDKGSDLGKQVVSYSTRGELVPDELTIRMWKEHVDGLMARGMYRPSHDLLVLDGIPRNVVQAQALDPAIEVLKIVHLGCKDESAMVERMKQRAIKENRTDDADERVILKRFDVYRRETAPVLGRYPRQTVVDVDAAGSPARVLQRILEVVVPIQEANFTSGSSARVPS